MGLNATSALVKAIGRTAPLTVKNEYIHVSSPGSQFGSGGKGQNLIYKGANTVVTP